MTLVPIIYTCLLIFSSFLLFVFVISYISYKAKASVRSSKSIKPITEHRFAMAGYTIPIDYRVANPSSMPRQSSRPRTIRNNSSTKKHITQNIAVRRTENEYQDGYNLRLNQTEKYDNMKKRSVANTSSTANQFVEAQRFEKMKQRENSRTFEERTNYKENLPKHNPNLAEMNLLNYYSDNNENDMVTLSASQYSKVI